MLEHGLTPFNSSPFVPGHKWMGDAWFAISDKATGIERITTKLQLPAPPTDIKGVLAINTAVENSVSDISILVYCALQA